jgi:LytR_cpsA_psr family
VWNNRALVPPTRSVGRLLLAASASVFVLGGALTSCAPAPPAADPSTPASQPTQAPTPTAGLVVGPVPPTAVAALPTAVAAPTVSQPTPAPTATVKPESQFERVLRPFLNEARRRREARASEPGYANRIDKHLTDERLNFLLFGYGETHEPPLTERAFIGSLTVFSYDYRTQNIDLISLTHDIRAPEIERYLMSRGQSQVGPIKIDQAYSTGGFELMRRTLEDATGLSIDFSLAFKESAIAGATDDVFGGLEVDVPLAFDVNAFYLDGQKYPGGSFVKGRQKLNGMQVIQFIKTVPVEQHYDPALEHNARKHLVFRAIMDALRANASDVPFLGRAALFFTGQVARDSIAYDFDLGPLLVDNLKALMADFGRTTQRDARMPEVDRTMYVVDPASGDGSVQWVKANAVTNPATRRDLDEGRYGETAMEVPYHGDANAPDLVAGYWTDVRALIASRLAD